MIQSVSRAFILTAMLFSASVSALERLPTYVSGKKTCAKYSEITSKEHGRFIEVPKNYDLPGAGRTPLYFWSHLPLNPALPTLIFLPGGPGESVHQNPFLDSLSSQLNIVLLDLRGTNCSKPELESDYLDPLFYSSEAIARDIEEVRKAIGVPSVSVYGHSFGTVVATIYASLFPESVRSVVLEGTIYEGSQALYATEYERKLIQAHFDSLPKALREQVLRFSRHPNLSPNWYSRANHFMLYLDDSFTALDYWLEQIFSNDSEEQIVNALQTFSRQEPSIEDEFGFGHILFGMIACQELGMALPDATFGYVFDKSGQLVSDADPSPQNNYCQDLSVLPLRAYNANRYPVTVPVTYFQGEYDGATSLPNAQQHFESVPIGQAQFLVLEKGGHSPNRSRIGEKELDSEPQRELFLAAVLGQKIDQNLIERFNSVSALKWTIQRKTN